MTGLSNHAFPLSKASDGNRTRDLFTTNEVRYRLCHASLSLSTHLLYYNSTCRVKKKKDGFFIIVPDTQKDLGS